MRKHVGSLVLISAIWSSPFAVGASKRLAMSLPSVTVTPGIASRLPLEEESRAAVSSTSDEIASIITSSVPDARFLVSFDPLTREAQITPSVLTPPGEYEVEFTIRDNSGSEYTGTVRAAANKADPFPLGVSPVILLNGYQLPCFLAATDSSGTFGSMESYLGSSRVRFFNNCVEGSQSSIETLGQRLGEYLDSLQYQGGTPVTQVDVVAHSMGGLIVRAYLSGKKDDGTFAPPVIPKIRKFIMVGTPNFGASFGGITLDQQAHEMLPGSRFLWDLATWNQNRDDLRGVDALAIAGSAGTDLLGNPDLDDGLVPMVSAAIPESAGYALNRTRVVPYCHATVVPPAWCPPSAGYIAEIDSPNHLTWQITNSFLSGTSQWQSIGQDPSNSALAATVGLIFGYADNMGRYYAPDSQLTASLQSITSGQTIGLSSSGDSSSPALINNKIPKGKYSVSMRLLGTTTTFPLDLTGESGYTVLPLRSYPAITGVQSAVSPGPGLTITSGGQLKVVGAGFVSSGVATSLFAGGTQLSITTISDEQITAVLPTLPAGLVPLTVVNGYGQHTVNIVTQPSSNPAISLSLRDMRFSAISGGTPPPSQGVVVSNTGGGTFLWSASTSATWMNLALSPGLLSVSTNPSGLAPGTYTGSITVSAAGVPNSPQTISVTLTVTPAQISLSTSAVSFNLAMGASPVSQSITISGGASILPFTSAVASTTPWLSVAPATGTTPSNLVVTVNPSGLAIGSYSGQIRIMSNLAGSSPSTLTVNLTIAAVAPIPTITSVVNGASLLPGIQSGSWITIKGANLSATTRIWDPTKEIINGVLPISLDGVRVTVGGQSAVVYYISPTQINALAPNDPAVGPVQVTIATPSGTSAPFSAQLLQYSPGFFTFDAQSSRYTAAVHQDGVYLGPTGLYGSALVTTPAKSGETILLFGTGFGPTNPTVATDRVFSGAAPLAGDLTITVGGVIAPVQFAGISSNGLYQFNVTVPILPNGDYEVLATVSGSSSQQGVFLSVQN